MKNRKSFIIGLKSTSLELNEIRFLKKYKPWGIILFKRNIKSIKQSKILTDNIKKIFNDYKYPILIDQEGGKVNRLSNIIDVSFFTSEFFGKLYKKNTSKFEAYYKIFIKQTSYLLKSIGANINTVPVLDLRYKKKHKIIGNRSFGSNPKTVSKIGDFCIKEYLKNNIGTSIKHIPGHGLAKVDSHQKTPVVKETFKKLIKTDFYPFKNKKSLLAMTAHIIYEKIDPIFTATHSRKIIKLIRKKIGFKNLIISDDISMKGLKFNIKDNVNNSFKAGCNLVLHCNGKMSEMIIVAKNAPKVDSFIVKKTSQFYKKLS
ncbi:glycoside hydrolase family 3 protein [Candidatus Pelagibacter sp.]|nr:glycoside hydrolase family 3 protein [Candidatus Pelagibacter sp.]